MNQQATIHEVLSYLETIAPLAHQEAYDNSGLLTGERSDQVQGVLVTLDCTEAIVEEAIRNKCNLIVAHHPVIFGGLKKITGSTDTERTLLKAIRHHIAIYAIHTNLDNQLTDGVNSIIADKLGLIHTRILTPSKSTLKKLVTFVPPAHLEQVKNALFSAGGGHIGNYDECSFTQEGTGSFRGNELSHPFTGKVGERHHEKETRLELIFSSHLQHQLIAELRSSHPYEEPAFDIIPLENENPMVGAGLVGDLAQPMSPEVFLEELKIRMKLTIIRHTPFEGQIRRIAVCGGSGSFLLNQAIYAGADAFVSADFKYHQFFDAENKLMIADIGHYESENFTKDLLKHLILKKFTTFAVLLSGINTNPIKYY